MRGGEARHLRELQVAVLVGQALARLLPRLAEVGAAPDARAVPLARRGGEDRARVGVADHVVDRPALAERAAHRPVATGLVALEQEAPFPGPDHQDGLRHASPPDVSVCGVSTYQTSRGSGSHRCDERRAPESTALTRPRGRGSVAAGWSASGSPWGGSRSRSGPKKAPAPRLRRRPSAGRAASWPRRGRLRAARRARRRRSRRPARSSSRRSRRSSTRTSSSRCSRRASRSTRSCWSSRSAGCSTSSTAPTGKGGSTTSCASRARSSRCSRSCRAGWPCSRCSSGWPRPRLPSATRSPRAGPATSSARSRWRRTTRRRRRRSSSVRSGCGRTRGTSPARRSRATTSSSSRSPRKARSASAS